MSRFPKLRDSAREIGLVLSISLLCLSCSQSDGDLVRGMEEGRHPVAEASGIVKLDGTYLLVDDEQAAGYFRVPAFADSVGRIDPDEVRFDSLAGALLPLDLEGIEVLADGRVVALSERNRTLTSHDGIVVEYDDLLAEVGSRGLEGVAVRARGATSIVAVVWEGGYMRADELPGPLHQPLGGSAFNAFVVVHRVDSGAVISVDDGSWDDTVTLNLPVLDPPTRGSSYRVPDLVWYRLSQDPETWGFIALLNSFDSLLLQRFDAESGRPVGDALDLGAVESIPASVRALEPKGRARLVR